MTRSLLIATRNPGKLREVHAILEGLNLRLTRLNDHPDLPEASEDGDTFEENAKHKALHYARLVGRWALADDSGLEVDALEGAPGVRSARYAGPGCDTAANNAKLIQALAAIPQAERTARFRCVIAMAGPAGVLATTSGTIEGVIIDDARGTNGFGYDPHFLVPELGLTTAEMPPEQKNRISHRGQALRAIRPAIERFLASSDAGALDI